MSKYIIRFDDITPGMNWDNFLSIKNVLESYSISSILGVVPCNRDKKLIIHDSMSSSDFFIKVKSYKDYGDTIAQHGTYHHYINKSSGLLDINNKSEFSGLCYEEQLQKLKIGKEVLESQGVWQPYFMAPSHSFDLNTLKALKALGFKAITDGYGFYPYQVEGITLVPQLVGKPIPLIPFGVQTICLHTNSMNNSDIDSLIGFIQKNHSYFVDFKKAVNISPKSRELKLFAYITSKHSLNIIRKIRRII